MREWVASSYRGKQYTKSDQKVSANVPQYFPLVASYSLYNLIVIIIKAFVVERKTGCTP